MCPNVPTLLHVPSGSSGVAPVTQPIAQESSSNPLEHHIWGISKSYSFYPTAFLSWILHSIPSLVESSSLLAGNWIYSAPPATTGLLNDIFHKNAELYEKQEKFFFSVKMCLSYSGTAFSVSKGDPITSEAFAFGLCYWLGELPKDSRYPTNICITRMLLLRIKNAFLYYHTWANPRYEL